MKRVFPIALALMSLFLSSTASSVLAQRPVPIAPNAIQGIGPFGTNLGSGALANSQFAKILSTIVGALTVGGGIWFIFQIIMGALNWISSGGEKTQLQGAQKKITNAVVGLTIIVGSLVIISVIGYMLGFDILNFNIVNLVP